MFHPSLRSHILASLKPFPSTRRASRAASASASAAALAPSRLKLPCVQVKIVFKSAAAIAAECDRRAKAAVDAAAAAGLRRGGRRAAEGGLEQHAPDNTTHEFIVSGHSAPNSAAGVFIVTSTSQGGQDLFEHFATFPNAAATLPLGGFSVYYDVHNRTWALITKISTGQALNKLIESITYMPYAATDSRFALSVDSVGVGRP